MTKLRDCSSSQYTPLIETLFGRSTPSSGLRGKPSLSSAEMDLTFFDASLNDSQKDAIRFALAAQEVALIHGPPGVSIQPS